jgi:polysaccharide export outer membrane protein
LPYLLLLAVFSNAAPAQFLGPSPQPSPASDTVPAASPPPPTADLRSLSLMPGDLCEVQIFGITQYDYRARIDGSGEVALPLVGTVRLGDLSIPAAERAIADRLIAAELVRNPQVSLHVLETPNHSATVAGEVKTPGLVPVYGDRRLLDVLSAAGGMTPLSSPLITLYHRGSRVPVQVTLPADPAASGDYNIPISAGDEVVVAKLGVVYILGAVHQQGALPLKTTSPLTLIEAMSLAGGVNYEAALNKAYILRVSPDGRREIPFNVAEVLKHHSADRALQNDDIVLIPTSNMKAALKGGAAGVAASLLAGVGYISVR